MSDAPFPPPGSCDCHVHVIGPKNRFPLSPNRTYTPKDAVMSELRAMLARLDIERTVIVQPSIYGTDNSCTLDAMDEIGATARAVAVLRPDTAGSTLDDLHRRGVRGLRVNVATSPIGLDTVRQQLKAATTLAARNGWHVQIFATPDALDTLAHELLASPGPIVIDHFGLISPGKNAVARAGTLIRLLGTGKVWVKLSAPYRIADDPYDPGIVLLARALADANPDRVVWGSDWPHTPPHPGGPITDREEPYRDLDTRALLHVTRTWLPDARMQSRLLVENPAKLYDFH